MSAGAGGGVPINTLIAARATFLFTGQDATLEVAHEIVAASGSFAFTGQAATLAIRNHVVDAGDGAFAVTGQASTLTVGPAPGQFELIGELGQFVFSGDTMTPVIDNRLPTETGAFAVTGQAATLNVARELVAGSGSFTFTGQDATLTKSAAAYQGPGDVLSGWLTWYSPARAYSAAFAATGGAIMDIVDGSGANQTTINILATGFVDLVTLNAWIVLHGTAHVKTLYDQSGNSRNVTNATVSQMPTITQSALNGLPGLTGTAAANSNMTSTATFTRASPYSWAAVAKRTANNTTLQALIGSSGALNVSMGFHSTANTVYVDGSGSSKITLGSVTDNSFHAIQGVVNGASSIIAADGTESTGSAGSTGFSTNTSRIMRFAGGSSMDGMWMEGGMYPGAFTGGGGGQISSINSNAHDATSGYGSF